MVWKPIIALLGRSTERVTMTKKQREERDSANLGCALILGMFLLFVLMFLARYAFS